MTTDESAATPIAISYPNAEHLHLRFGVGACRLVIAPGAGDAWLQGTYRDPSGALPLQITREGGTVRVSQGQQFESFPRLLGQPARFDLRLGTARPCTLTIESGASEVHCDLGGVPLTALALRQGAGKATLDFSSPNPRAMDLLEISAGAAATDLVGLANAGARQLRISGGAASFTLDFGGALARDADARFSGGMANVTIQVPATTAAMITAEAVLGTIDAGDGFARQDRVFGTQAAVAGQSPVLTIHANAALGSIHLRTG
jgi:hypothetical protein